MADEGEVKIWPGTDIFVLYFWIICGRDLHLQS